MCMCPVPREIELPAVIHVALGIMETHKLPNHYKLTVHQVQWKNLIDETFKFELIEVWNQVFKCYVQLTIKVLFSQAITYKFNT